MRTRLSVLIGLSALATLVVAGVALGMVLRPRPLYAAAEAASQREITVIGQGTAKAEPDTLIVQLGVQTQAPSAKAALQENNTRMQALWTRLKKLGIPETALATGNFSIWSNQEGPMPENVGYRVENRLTVTLKQGHESGALLQQVVDAGANSIAGITFTVARPEDLERQARDQALANARSRAQAMAKASGASLGTLLRITEESGAPPSMGQGAAAGGREAAAGVPISPGDYTATAFVRVTFELK